MGFAYIIMFLHIFEGTGVGGAKFRLENNCAEIIWPAISGQPTLSGLKLDPGNTVAVQAPLRPWGGSLWGRTGCNFSASGYDSCATGGCGSRQLQCQTYPFATTLAKMSFDPDYGLQYYSVSIINGYNLPLALQAIGETSSWGAAGCTKDLNPLCPPELRTRVAAHAKAADTQITRKCSRKLAHTLIPHPTNPNMYAPAVAIFPSPFVLHP
ncbi:hypothetical protein ACS0TY_008611 [Phlomoides rotata]